MTSTNAPAIKKKKSEVHSAPISLALFLSTYSNMEDGFKYEWNHGFVEKSSARNQEQTTLFLLLSRLFCRTKAFEAYGGLAAETDMMTSKTQLRRPDISYYSGAQVKKMKKGQNQIPQWVAEVISESDNINSCLLYTSPSPRDKRQSRMPSSA